MKLTKNAIVFSSTGEKIGSLERVVLDPDTMKVTNLVVKEGTLFSVDKLVPIQYLNREVDKQITLNKTAEDLEALPSYEESSYVSFNRWDYSENYDDLNTDIETVYWYPPITLTWWAMVGPIRTPIPKYVKKAKVIPAGKVALEEGAKVISRGGKTMGSVEQVIVESDETHATHIVVGSGLLAKEYKLVPTLWVKDVVEDRVYLTVRSDFFERLPEHELAP